VTSGPGLPLHASPGTGSDAATDTPTDDDLLARAHRRVLDALSALAKERDIRRAEALLHQADILLQRLRDSETSVRAVRQKED